MWSHLLSVLCTTLATLAVGMAASESAKLDICSRLMDKFRGLKATPHPGQDRILVMDTQRTAPGGPSNQAYGLTAGGVSNLGEESLSLADVNSRYGVS